MNENSFVWSLNKEKFLKIIGMKGKYKEKLGWNCNSLWYLMISYSNVTQYGRFNSFLQRRDEYYKKCLSFTLYKEHKTSSFNSTVFCFSDIQLLFEGELEIPETENASILIKDNVDDYNNYKLDLVLTFPESTDINTIPFDPKLLSKTEDLSNDFLKMLDEDQFSDVTLKCKTKVIMAHKNILCKRSSVFAAMFANNMQESQTNTVTVDDIDPEIFSCMICFLYSGRISIDSISMAVSLLDCAEKYHIATLKEGSIDYLKLNLTFQNVIEILKIADLYDKQLKQAAIIYANDHLNKLKNTKDWLNLKLENPSLALEVFEVKT